MSQRNILFICTGNCARSQLAEGLMRHLAGGRMNVYSAGVEPADYVHPLALATLEALGIPTAGLYSKGCDDLADQPFDIVITLCDYAASVPLPEYPGEPVIVHWGLTDPTFLPGSERDRQKGFADTAQILRNRLQKLIELPLDELSPDDLRRALVRLAG